MNKIAYIALCFGLAGTAQAADPVLVINGVSTHFGVEGFNERNTGLGMEFRREDNYYCAGGILENSMRDTSVYVGCGRRWWAGSSVKVGAGLFAGAVRYPSAQLNTLPAVLPVASIEYRGAGVNFILIPAVTDDMSTALLAQFYVGF